MLLCRRFETADRGIGLRPAQRADVREEVQQSLLGLQQAGVVGARSQAQLALLGQHLGDGRRVQVESHEIRVQRLVRALPAALPLVGERAQFGEVQPAACDRSSDLSLADTHQGSRPLDFGVDRDQDVRDLAREWRGNSRFHLHALQHDQRVTGIDPVAGLHEHGDDECGPAGADDTAVVSLHPVRRVVDIDQEGRSLRGDDDVVGPASDRQQALVRSEPTHAHLDCRVSGLDQIGIRVGAEDSNVVGVSAIPQRRAVPS